MSAFTDVKGDKRRHTVVLDLDGTLVEGKWPELGDWLPGAKEAIRALHTAGIKLVVFSARLNPYDPWTSQPRSKAEVAVMKNKVRDLLDESGFYYVDIWSSPGKPGASVYVDDRAERYHGRPGSWKALVEKILLRLGVEDPETPETVEDPALDYTAPTTRQYWGVEHCIQCGKAACSGPPGYDYNCDGSPRGRDSLG